MNDIANKKFNEIMKIKDEHDLPPHISYNEYQSLLNAIDNEEYRHYLNKKLVPFLKARDRLLVMMMWELGGRVSDIINIQTKDVDFSKKEIILTVKKRHGYINRVPVSDALLLEISNFMREFNTGTGRLFSFTRQRAWEIVKGYGRKIGLELHPHMFRHGLAIYLLQHGVSDKIIARRLGHSSAATTIKYYMVITPEIEREALKGVLL
ncbi:site-specific integrase [Acidiplasma sp. MBA-1]|uniref:tyrosine-type recombinase/integrase n=1 Tax=Acidiplasma sp. MBA-1 TaxID=1293648 RepID=UPI0005E2CE4A|nr:site-specific integrase [Acidiplasma sp. MBA-1]KJE49321.1 integrase [Acidiplasma sp. MBA-1]